MKDVVALAFALLSNFLLLQSSPAEGVETKFDHRHFRQALLAGQGTQIDFGFAYFQNRSPESMAEELAANGISCLHYFVLDDRNVNRAVIDACHARGIAVYAALFATSVYNPPAIFPEGWEQWKMEFTHPLPGPEWRHLSFVHEGYRQWMKKRVVTLLKKYPFDGVVLMETHYPNFDGLTRKKVFFADVSPGFQNAFKKATGHAFFPNFTDPQDPHYFKKDTRLFHDLLDFRVKAVIDFLDTIYNGPGGVREQCPGRVVATWSLALSWKNAPELLREWEGQDAAAMVKKVKPDIHFFQTHFPDWNRGDLPPDYVLSYKTFVRSVKAVNPRLPLGIQADVGTLYVPRKTARWYRLFLDSAEKAGFSATTYAQFDLRWQVANNLPVVVGAYHGDKPEALTVVFDQRLDPSCSDRMINRKISMFTTGEYFTIDQATVDGNLLLLHCTSALPESGTLSIPVGGVSDDPSVRIPMRQAAGTDIARFGPRNTIPHPCWASVVLERFGSNHQQEP